VTLTIITGYLAPVECVVSRSGLIIRPHRAQLSDSLLETLVFLK
jgi:hypothetical protein